MFITIRLNKDIQAYNCNGDRVYFLVIVILFFSVSVFICTCVIFLVLFWCYRCYILLYVVSMMTVQSIVITGDRVYRSLLAPPRSGTYDNVYLFIHTPYIHMFIYLYTHIFIHTYVHQAPAYDPPLLLPPVWMSARAANLYESLSPMRSPRGVKHK